MSRYRYTRSNGQFFPSKFVDATAESTDQSFRTDQSYSLVKDFISGSDESVNSFVTGSKVSGYTAKDSLVGWWRLGNTSTTTLVEDISGNGYDLVTAGTKIPTESSSSPSSFISAGSLSFDGSDDVLETSGVAAGAAFSFTDDSGDTPFSVSFWIKPLSSSTDGWVMAKGDSYNNSEWGLQYKATNQLVVALFPLIVSDSSNSVTSTGVIPVDVWTHIVVTYNGTAISAAGTSNDNGIRIYKNGSLLVTSPNTDTDYTGMVEDTSMGFGLSKFTADPANPWKGNLADVAIWSKALSATDAAHLYGVSTAGAYRLVIDFEKVSVDNDTRVLGIATGKRGFDVSSWAPDIMNQFVQGINVVSFDQLLNYTTARIRTNSSFIKTLNGRDISTIAFDEGISVTSFSSGSSVSHINIDTSGKLSERLSHERENRDLGQTTIYDNNEPYEDTLDLNPVTIIEKHPLNLVLPSSLVSQTGEELMDGVIEPLVIRSKIDGSSTESPFYAHDIRASLGGKIDGFRRSYIITDGWDLDEPAKGAAPFLDSVENMGFIDIPGAFSDNFAKIEPYVDYANDRDKEYTTNNVSSTISTVLIQSASWSDNDSRTYDKMAAHGYVFDGDTVGIDSITYGGLKK